MKNNYALVTVRTSSTRLPAKCKEVIVDDLSLVQIVIRRAKKIGCPVILVTTDHSSDNHLETVASKEGVECFRGALNNKICRWYDCFKKYDISYGLLVDGDDPTFDYYVGKRALETLHESGAELIMSDPKLTPGFFTYGINNKGIEKLFGLASNPDTNTDVITEYINKADLKKVYVQPKKEERLGHNIRLTIDYPEDLEFYRTLYKEVNYMASGPEIVNVCLANSFQKINWHKHGEFLDNQKMFNQKVRSKIIKDMGNYE